MNDRIGFDIDLKDDPCPAKQWTFTQQSTLRLSTLQTLLTVFSTQKTLLTTQNQAFSAVSDSLTHLSESTKGPVSALAGVLGELSGRIVTQEMALCLRWGRVCDVVRGIVQLERGQGRIHAHLLVKQGAQPVTGSSMRNARLRYVRFRQVRSDTVAAWRELSISRPCQIERQMLLAIAGLLEDLRVYWTTLYDELQQIRPLLLTSIAEARQRRLARDPQPAPVGTHDVMGHGELPRSVVDLMKALCGADLVIAEAFCASVSSDRLVERVDALVHVADGLSVLEVMLRTSVKREIDATASAGTLFRGNTISTRLLAAFGRVMGDAFVASLLAPLFDRLSAAPDGFELNDEEDNAPHREWFKGMCSDLIARLTAEPAPERLCWMACVLRKAVEKKFGDSGLTAVGGLVCLRLISPAILAASVEAPAARMAHKMASKFLQNASNGIAFREPTMAWFNDTLAEHTTQLHEWFALISNGTETDVLSPRGSEPWHAYVDVLMRILVPTDESKEVECEQELERMSKALMDRDGQTRLFGFMATLAAAQVDANPRLD